MNLKLDGATRLYPIIGDPIAQVKSPAGVSETLQAAGLNALVVPLHVQSPDFAGCMAQLQTTHNVGGGIITVPHKFAAASACATLSERAGFLGAVNTFRRSKNGAWHGDMFDGLGYVTALRKNGCHPEGKRVLLVGAGGAGSAIAYTLVQSGVAELVICDPDTQRREGLIKRLNGLPFLKYPIVRAGSNDPRGFDVALNASPMGMNATDPLPIDASGFAKSMFVGDVITAPAVTAMLLQARMAGCRTQTGADMFAAVRDLMVAFLLEQSD